MGAIAKQRPLSETTQPQQSQMLPGSVFRSCFNLIQQGEIGLGLDLLERLIAQHGPPDKADGFAILLVSPYILQSYASRPTLALDNAASNKALCIKVP